MCVCVCVCVCTCMCVVCLGSWDKSCGEGYPADAQEFLLGSSSLQDDIQE